LRECLKFYIGGEWVDPAGPSTLEVINPATETPSGRVALGTPKDVDRAVKAARAAFADWSTTSVATRIGLLERILVEYQKRYDDMADAISTEMGAPLDLAKRSQARLALEHLQAAVRVLNAYRFSEPRGTTMVVREPIGVCGLITPWNWPMNQIGCKVAPALATGCTIVLKPSEIAPFSAYIFAEIMHAAGVPAGVFNLVNGDGPTVGAAISGHREVDMVSFTGSTRAGIEVTRNAAPTVKRVHLELGGKSPNIILDDADFESAVAAGVLAVMRNSGQSCNAPTRMLVPRARMSQVIATARATVEKTVVGDPRTEVDVGPVVSKAQWTKIQALIEKGVLEGATIVAGGPGRPAGLPKGYFVRPTVFANVTPEMVIAREEIFGPVLSIMAYETVEHAIELANGTEYGLAAYVWGADLVQVRAVASRLRAGQVILNGAPPDFMAPFGGYKQSGNGREWGDHAFAEFLETKAVVGFASPIAAEQQCSESSSQTRRQLTLGDIYNEVVAWPH
jgi:aldehyde dehydrogenase (NAD+)